MPVATDEPANNVDLEDAAAAASDVAAAPAAQGKSVDGVARKPIFRSERQIPEPTAPADGGNLYGRQAGAGESYYDERGVYHPGKDQAPSIGGQRKSDGEDGDDDGDDEGDGEGDDGEGSGGQDFDAGKIGKHLRGDQTEDTVDEGLPEPSEGFEQRGAEAVGEAGESAAGEAVAEGAAEAAAELAAEEAVAEAAAAETFGLSLVALGVLEWLKAHPRAATAIVCALLLAILAAVVLTIVLVGEFACNGTILGIASWIYGHVGGTNYCGQIPKIS
jgi:hypothetical protein